MSTDLQQKNASSLQSHTEAPDFASWEPTTLAKFARDAYLRMREQEDELLLLRQDLKAAIHAYRDLLRR